MTELTVTIEDQLSRSLIIGESLTKPLADPSSSRVGGNANVEDLATGVVDDEEDVEHLEGHRRHSEKVHSSKAVSVIAKKCHPTLIGIRIDRAFG